MRQIAALQRLLARMRQRVDFVEGSVFWKMRARYFALKARFGFVHDPAPPEIPAAEYVEVMAPDDPYAAWLLEHEPRRADLERLREFGDALAVRPRVALIVDDPPAIACDAALAHARAQVYARTSVLATSAFARDGASLASFAARCNAALAACDAEWVAFVEADTLLAPDATFEVALAAADPAVRAVYGDRDEIDPDGRRHDPVFAPGFSPESLLSNAYFGKLVFYRRELLEALGGLRDVGSPHFDLALRASEQTQSFARRARILHHHATGVLGPPAPAWEADAAAVSAACDRRGTPARTERFDGYDGAVIPRFSIDRAARAEIIVPTRDHADDLKKALDGVFSLTAGIDFRVTVIDNGSVEAETAELLAFYAREQAGRFQTLRIDEPFNFSHLINAGAAATDGPFLVSLNNDTEILDGSWLEALVEYAQLPQIGAVGARLTYGDGTIQHAGVTVGLGRLAGHPYRFARPDDPGPGGALFSIRNYSAVTAAVLATRRDAFDAVGGFDEAFAVEFNDVDFCLRLGLAGLRSVYLPHVRIRHYESKTRATADTPQKRARVVHERALFEERWKSSAFRDPYYNPNLTLLDETAGLGS